MIRFILIASGEVFSKRSAKGAMANYWKKGKSLYKVTLLPISIESHILLSKEKILIYLRRKTQEQVGKFFFL